MFDGVVLAVAAVLLIVIYELRVLPLSSSPAPPPRGLHLAWAGAPIQGYHESVFVAPSECGQPARIIIGVYAGARTTGRAASGQVAFAFSGGYPGAMPAHVRVFPGSYIGVLQGRYPRVRLPTPLSLRHTTWLDREDPRAKVDAYSFSFESGGDLAVELSARWTEKRDSQSCWLRLPKLLGFDDLASYAANAAVGHRDDWMTSYRGFPLDTANIELDGGSLRKGLRGDSADAIPTPASLDPMRWSCTHAGDGTDTSDCQAFAVLSHPDADAHRTRSLTLWSVGAGLLLAIFGDALIAVLRMLTVKGRHD